MPTLADLLSSYIDQPRRTAANLFADPVRQLIEMLHPSQEAFAETPQEKQQRLMGRVGSVMPGVAQPALEDLFRPSIEAGTALTAGMAPAVAKVAERAAAALPAKSTIEKLGYDPEQMAMRYPEQGPPKMDLGYPQKKLTPEALAVQKVRNAAQRDIDAGNYTPFFDPAQRAHIDPTEFPEMAQGTTLTEALAKKPETIAKWQSIFDVPSARQKLAAAMSNPDPSSWDWYAIKQLYDQAKGELGQPGARQFMLDTTGGMSATTSGADPKMNLMTTTYGNFMRNLGLPAEEQGWAMPFPVGGRYGGTNMAFYNRMFGGNPLTAADQPKRWNFQSNQLGYLDRATMDENMMRAFPNDPATGRPYEAPPVGSYGVVEGVAHDVARGLGLLPASGQDRAWAALKGTSGKPLIQEINEMIERGSRVTRMPPDVVTRGFLRRNMPMYGMGGAALGTGALLGSGDDTQPGADTGTQ
jgi:hypothetical protein